MNDQIAGSPLAASFTTWLRSFESALTTRNAELFDSLFLEDAKWRDVVAFTWNLRQVHSREEIRELVWAVLDEIRPADFRLTEKRPVPATNEQGVSEAFFSFETAAGSAVGILYAVADPEAESGLRASVLFTQLKVIRGSEPQWPKYGRYDDSEKTWPQHLADRKAFADHDPEVLIAGGGQHGVMVAAQLDRLGVDNLIVDMQKRPGDAWRTRYKSLVLHQPYDMLHFAFMRFPENFPEYIPKDKMADFMESYVTNMDLNYWTSTEFLGGTYDEEKGEWTVELRLGDGSLRVMHPKHVVLATGGNEIPNLPDLPGLDSFKGPITHSTKFHDGDDYAGKKVIVVGAATSAHDIALDIVKAGGQATMIQRRSVIVVQQDTANITYGDYNDKEVPTDLSDIRLLAGGIYPIMFDVFKQVTQIGNAADHELHEQLDAIGFKRDSGEDETGWFMKYFRTGSGYYINVGGSDAIVRGEIDVLQYDEIDTFVENGLKLADGTVLEADAIILATGFQNQKAAIAKYFGNEIGEKVGLVWGFDDGGEIRNGWKPTNQPGLWIMIAGIPQARIYGEVVALEIKAELEGLVPAEFKAPNHITRTPVKTLTEVR